DYYPHYISNCFFEVSDEIAIAFSVFKKREAAYQSRKQYNRAQYSIDRNDGIEDAILHKELSAEDAFERESTITQILNIMATLPNKQARRIYACYFLGLSKTELAKAEGVSRQSISASIRDGLRNIRKILEKSSK
ncbi:MAG: sigma-70 family RNA polymerase sigma factor, partial [Ethanoligenens sp.]